MPLEVHSLHPEDKYFLQTSPIVIKVESLLLTETTCTAGHFRNAGLSTLSSALFFQIRSRRTESVPQTTGGAQHLTGSPGEGKMWHLNFAH